MPNVQHLRSLNSRQSTQFVSHTPHCQTDEDLKRQLAELDEKMKQRRLVMGSETLVLVWYKTEPNFPARVRRVAVIAKFSVKKTPAKTVAPGVGASAKRKRRHHVLPQNLRDSLHGILGDCDLEKTTFTQASYRSCLPAPRPPIKHGSTPSVFHHR